MTTKRKFYRTICVVEILSEDEYPDSNWSLQSLANQIEHGGMSISYTFTKPVRLSGKQMADALEAQSSEPEFFSLDRNGRSVF